MTQTINRMFADHETASRAAESLRQHRFDRFDDVFVVGRVGGADSATPGAELSSEAIVGELLKAYVLRAHAKILAEGIRRGGAVVIVHAPFGLAASAIETLEQHGPIESGVPDFSDPPAPWDEATPCSSSLGLPVLLSDKASFSDWWGLPLLVRGGATTSSALGLPELSAQRGPLRTSFGLPLLSDSATPLSSLLGLPLLTKPRR